MRGHGNTGWIGWRFVLADIATDTFLAELTEVVTAATISPRLNRPFAANYTIPADVAEINTVWTDGDPYMTVGTRCIKAIRNGVLVSNNIVWTVEYDGDEDTVVCNINTFDPMIRLDTRALWDPNVGVHEAHVSGWQYHSPMTPVEMLQDAFFKAEMLDDRPADVFVSGFTNAQIFPIDYTSGQMSATGDLSFAPLDLPMTIGDLYRWFGEVSGVTGPDMFVQPCDTDDGLPAGIMGILNVVNQWGRQSPTVTFAYGEGSYNVKAGRRSFDMSTFIDRLWYFGAKLDSDSYKWQGIIEGQDPIFDGTGIWDAESAARRKYGTYTEMTVQESSLRKAAGVREFYDQLFATEISLRVKPREMLFLTPIGGDVGGPLPFTDYNIGDVVAVDTALLGPSLAADQRIYGFDITVDEDGVETVSELIASADGE